MGTELGTRKWEPIWYTKMGTDLVTTNGNSIGVPKLFFLDQHHTDLMCANGNRYLSQAYCLCANTLIRVVSKSGRRCGFKGSRSFGSKGNRRIDTECLGRRCIVDNIYVIPEDDTDVDPEKQLSLAATAGAFWVFEIYI